MMRKRSGNRKKLNQMQFIASGFLAMIIIGTLLLMLPISSLNGEWTSPLSALFTATSASCVTGLVVVDTFTHWSLFGQIIILALIQIGGLGFITIGVGFAVAFQRHIGLRQRDLLKESVNAIDLGGIIRLWKNIVKGTAVFEGVGAILLAIRFMPRFGIGRGIYFGIFHSVSAFCNAGFDLMGINEEYSSLVSMRPYHPRRTGFPCMEGRLGEKIQMEGIHSPYEDRTFGDRISYNKRIGLILYT